MPDIDREKNPLRVLIKCDDRTSHFRSELKDCFFSACLSSEKAGPIPQIKPKKLVKRSPSGKNGEKV